MRQLNGQRLFHSDADIRWCDPALRGPDGSDEGLQHAAASGAGFCEAKEP